MTHHDPRPSPGLHDLLDPWLRPGDKAFPLLAAPLRGSAVGSQGWNVLRGEMSLVGPRPTSFGPETYKLWHTHRLDVMPGITGLWQVFGRAKLEFDDRLRLDIAYIERASLRLDIQILILTVLAVFQQRGAR